MFYTGLSHQGALPGKSFLNKNVIKFAFKHTFLPEPDVADPRDRDLKRTW